MKRFLPVLLLAFVFTTIIAQHPVNRKFLHTKSTAQRSGAFIYTLTTSNEAYTDLSNATSLSNGDIWDEPEYSFPINFPFTILEDEIDGLAFYGSGSLMRAPSGDPDYDVYLFPFEADLIDRGAIEEEESLSPISYVVEGSPGNRILKLEFKNVGSYNEMVENNSLEMFISFQMWLYEGSNAIQFRYGPSSIDDPELFYGIDIPGAIVGTTYYNENEDELLEPHLVAGDPSNPVLTSDLDNFLLNGTPPEGTVYTLSIGEPLFVDLTATDVTSYCEANGEVASDVIGGVAPYTYIWSNGETSPDLTNAEAGTYSVTVTDLVGTTASESITVNNTVEPMTLEIDVTDETGTGANDGTATVTASEGLSPYSYLWSNGETTADITDLAPGTYDITVTDNAGCTETATALINAFGCDELEIESAVHDVNCFGNCDGSIDILEIFGGTGPYTYEWIDGSSEDILSGLCPGTYSVTVTDANQCIGIATYTVTEPTALTPNAFSTPESIEGAHDGTATAATFGGTPPYAYAWSNGETTQQIENLAPGEYSVIVTDNHNCLAFDTVTVEAGPCAVLTGIVTDATCHEACDGSIDIAPGFDVYIWSNGSSTGDLTNLCAGAYSVTATTGTCTVEAAFTVNEPDHLVANTGSTSESALGGDGTAWVIPSGGTPPFSYLWSNGSTDSLVTDLVADVYSVTLTDAHGCVDSADVAVEEFICFVIDQNEVQHVFCHDDCNGLIFVVPIGGIGPYEYAWSTGDTANIVFDLCEGWYSVTITDLGQNGCSNFVDIEILQPDTFYYTIEEIVHLTDSTEASIDVSFHGGIQPYFPLWFGPDLFVSFEEDISGLAPGTYILNLFDSHDCDITDTIEILDLTTSLPVLPEGAVDIYPNPASSVVYVDTDIPGAYTVELYSSIGTSLGTWENNRQIDVRAFAPGLYVVLFRHSDGYFVKSIMKN